MFTKYFDQIREMAIAAYPKEGVAVITNSGFRVLENISPRPKHQFEISRTDLAQAYADGLLAVVHSHPNGPDCPTAADMEHQIKSGVPWIITSTNGEACTKPFLFGDGAPIPDLVGRGFRHGVTDCYSLIRDFKRVIHNITIKEFPRDWEWWIPQIDDTGKEIKQELYLKGFAEAGFHAISEYDIEPGDVFLAQIRSPTPNHGGIYLGNELILHHLTATQPVDSTRLSVREPITRWKKFVTHWLRYEEDNTPR